MIVFLMGRLCDKPASDKGAYVESRCLLPVMLTKGQIPKTQLREHILLKLKSFIGLLSNRAVLETSVCSLGAWSIMGIMDVFWELSKFAVNEQYTNLVTKNTTPVEI